MAVFPENPYNIYIHLLTRTCTFYKHIILYIYCEAALCKFIYMQAHIFFLSTTITVRPIMFIILLYLSVCAVQTIAHIYIVYITVIINLWYNIIRLWVDSDLAIIIIFILHYYYIL